MTDIIRRHLRQFFTAHVCEEHVWLRGPSSRDLPELRVAEFAPGPRTNLWTYATVGANAARSDPRLEFFLLAPERNRRHVELATMIAWYHLKEGLGVGHTLPIGEPWLPGSQCESLLISLPYPLGKELQHYPTQGGDVDFLWALPITEAERQCKISHGTEALEQLFDRTHLQYWWPERHSVVPSPGQTKNG